MATQVFLIQFETDQGRGEAAIMNVREEVKEIEHEIISWRRSLHQIPELDKGLYKTTDFVKLRLDEMEIPYRSYSNMGISAVIEGVAPGPVIGFRADMDALPIKEETNLPFASSNGNMHACGHDAHTAMLLGAAKVLADNKSHFAGKVVLIFQPAEETFGGAQQMIEEGCLEEPKVDRLISLHIGTIFPEVANSKFGVKKGALLASTAAFNATVRGVGGHGASPHECVDPILIACEIIQSLQKLVSRVADPTHSIVLSIGMFHAGTTVNIIPGEAVFGGTVRTLDPKDADMMENRICEMITQIAKANGTTAEIDYHRYYPAIINNKDVTDFLARCTEKVIGRENVIEISAARMGTEDASYYLNAVPGSYGILGSVKAHDDGVCYPHHNSKFHLDESTFWIGSAVFVQCALDFCKLSAGNK